MILLILYYHAYIITLTLMIDLLLILVWHNTYTVNLDSKHTQTNIHETK